MSNPVFKRFRQGGMQQEVIQPIDTAIPDDEKNAAPPPLAPPVSTDILRQRLNELLMPQPKVIQEQSSPVIELIHFASLFEFAHWYENNRALFSERQQEPLNTLLEARNITLGGCNCDQEKRKMIVEDYFRRFWTENKKTDLLPTLQTILKTKKVLFGDFLVFPE